MRNYTENKWNMQVSREMRVKNMVNLSD